MRIMLVAALLALPMTPAFADGKVTWSNGASAEWTRDCVRADGQATCTANGTLTSATGKTASKTRVRTTSPGLSVSEITTTGPKGNTRTRTREVTWGN